MQQRPPGPRERNAGESGGGLGYEESVDMAIEQTETQVRLICDRTGKAFPWRLKSEFHAMIDEAKAARWQIFKENGEWKHVSPAL
jgi:hypothetical protein